MYHSTNIEIVYRIYAIYFISAPRVGDYVAYALCMLYGI